MKSSDTEILKSLQAQVNNLKAQLNPEQDSEKLLDDLFQLQLKRQQQIIQDGIDVTIGASEKNFRCLKADDSTLMFPAGTAIAPSMQVMHKGSLLGIVTGTASQAGRLKCSIWVPKQSAQTFVKSATATGHNLKQSGPSTPCQLQDGTITFYGKSFTAGTLLKCLESFFEVTGSYQDDNLYVHQVKAYEEAQQPAPIVNRSGIDVSDMQRGYNVYLNRFTN